ncbi:MAG: GSCFA domain-containing protein [Muribaculaceae bacterium]|nr:GSCFA domain-containing protein [Muribaculaceae bacterium]
MQFRTQVKPLDKQGLIDHSQRVLMIGSCFTENIGSRLTSSLFNVSVNPFGPLYNPLSIARSIDLLASQKVYTPDDTFCAEGLWHCYDFHSRFSSAHQSHALELMNRSIEAYQPPQVLILTLGSDAAFINKATGEVVANCHKQPQSHFELVHCSISTMRDALTGCIDKLRQVSPSLQVIFTVSPVRHLSYGASTNSRAKGRLIEAAMSIADDDPKVSYFHAYEIMMDDLRDYRFYATDMIHPSEIAVDYIFELFSQSYFTPTTQKLADECEALTRRLRHRPMSDNVANHQKFMDSTLQLAKSMMKKHPQLIPSIENLIHTHAL